MANTKFKLTHKGQPVADLERKYSRYIVWIKIPGVKLWRKVAVIRRYKKDGRTFEDDYWQLTVFKRGNEFVDPIRKLALTIGMDRIYTNMPCLEW